MPFDFFLRSLAEELGERAICVILSGTGGDGSLGLKAVKEKGGLVIALDPDEAEYKQASGRHHELAHMELSRTVSPPPLPAPYLCR